MESRRHFEGGYVDLWGPEKRRGGGMPISSPFKTNSRLLSLQRLSLRVSLPPPLGTLCCSEICTNASPFSRSVSSVQQNVSQTLVSCKKPALVRCGLDVQLSHSNVEGNNYINLLAAPGRDPPF